MKYDICIIDYFTKEFINNNPSNCLSILENSMPLEARGHGQAIVEIICEINPNINWSYFVIDKSATANDIYNILCYIEKYNIANIINMSFGYYEIAQNTIIQYENIINKMINKNMKLICATDEEAKKTFPASINGVFAVHTNYRNSMSKEIIIKGKDIFVPPVRLYVNWIDNKMIWVYGSSYYTAIVSAIFSKYSDDMSKDFKTIFNNNIGNILIRDK